MVRGIGSFREWFKGCDEQYAIIGGAFSTPDRRGHIELVCDSVRRGLL